MVDSKIAGRYHLNSILGRGGMGVVYQAHDAVLKRDVAIKLLSGTGLGTEGRARLMNEARATASLNHPNIIAVYDAGESDVAGDGDPQPYIVMELLDGPTLHDRPPKSLDQTLQITRQLCTALEHAHEHGIIHRDLKPENVMLVGDSTVKLMDFGLARSLTTRMTAAGTIMGTLFYMAPEMVMGQDIDGRADLYALGIMLYEMATGRLPFEAQDPVAVLTQHLHAPVVPPIAHNPELPPALDQLIVRLMEKKPDRRPASAAEVLVTLEAIERPETVSDKAYSLSTLDRIVRGRIVGREKEVAEARSIWQQAVSGQGQVLLVSGEPGIGKTRLVEELITLARVSGGRALSGASYAEGGVPYAPFRQVLAEALLDSGLDLDADLLADLLLLAPELRAHLPAPAGTTTGNPLEMQQRLLSSAGIYFSMLSKQAPLLLVLEDAHWADSATISLMRHLARYSQRSNLMLVVTYREVEIDEARTFHEALLDLQRERLATRIKLARLNKEETGILLATLFDEEITPEFLDSIYRETEGNPFFIEEITKALVESGQLTFKDGRWDRPPIEQLGIPQSIRVAIQTRANAISTDSLAILEQAAVLGRTFDLPTLEVATGQDEDILMEALDEALAAQLIQETAGALESFSFVHALIPAALIAGFRTLRRRRLQQRAATAFETIHPDNYEVLANLFLEAGNIEKGISYLLQAGDRARGQYAHEEAIGNYQAAIEYYKESGQLELAARTMMKLALAYNNAFDFVNSRRVYQEGFTLWQQSSSSVSDKSIQPAPHALRVPWSDQVSLDPGMSYDTGSSFYQDQLFCGLVQLTAEMDIMPDIASSWEIMNGGRHFRFHLREDVYWNDDVQVTAHDFNYAWRRILSPEFRSPNAKLFFSIVNGRAYHEGGTSAWEDVGVNVVDPFTLEVLLEKPDMTFIYNVGLNGAFAVPEHRLKELKPSTLNAPWMSREELVTNGPFRITEWMPGHKMMLEANPSYHGKRTGNVEKIAVHFVSLDAEDRERLDDYEANHLDITFPPNAYAVDARNRFSGDYLSLPQSGFQYLGYDTTEEPFNDNRVRRALTQSINKERMSQIASGGLEIPATGGLIPPGIPGHRPGIALPFDPELARRLLAEGGYPEGRDFPLLVLPHSHWNTRVADYLTREWHDQLGIMIKAIPLEYQTLLRKINQEHPAMFLLGNLAAYPEPDEFLGLDITQYTGWRDETFKRLLEQAKETVDQQRRLSLYKQAESILVEEAPIVPLIYTQWDVFTKPWVRRFPASPFKFWYFKDVVIDPH